jgi:hypothetical protein
MGFLAVPSSFWAGIADIPEQTGPCGRGNKQKEKKMTRKNAFKVIVCIMLACAVVGCASAQRSKTQRIEQGMTRQEVANIMGQPRDRKISGNTETWYYFQAGWSYNSDVWIYFTDGRVSGMQTDQ